ncbi:exo-alpha-sialidase [Scytonema sp. UIC 10036]|uniref:sialidase family protein n=1 Tax=Scytonema sp. UIC 10036 TaxID=2304196 RepID=UPI0012DA0C17|nr:sialidase family protein [Scytonema sp. UIC 10036]MUG93333.1 exo-alpha-sialidase [Scytonema sp. UIC 10036]
MFYSQNKLRAAPAALLSIFIVSSILPGIAIADFRVMPARKAIAAEDKKAPVEGTKFQANSNQELLRILQRAGFEIFSDNMRSKMLLTTVLLALSIGNTADRATEQTIESMKSPKKENLFSWRNVRLNGMGYISGMSISPVAPYDVYIRADIGGAYRYDRKNERWIPLMDMFSSSFSGGSVGVESIAADPVNPSRVYAVVKSVSGVSNNGSKKVNTYAGEVLVSNDRGKTWNPTGLVKHGIYVGPNDEYRNETGERLAIDPNDPNIIYFASRRHGLWKKEKQKDWTALKGGLPNPSSLPMTVTNIEKSACNSEPSASSSTNNKKENPSPGFTFVVFDKTTGKPGNPTPTLYVGIHGSGVWQSKNAGKSWRNIGGRQDPLRAIVASDGTLYVNYGTYGENNKTGGIAKFQNGRCWDITPDTKNRVYAAVSVQSDRPTVAMAISDRMVYRTKDGGKSWQHIEMAMGSKDPNYPDAPVNSSAPEYFLSYASEGAASIVIDPSNPQKVWWTNGWGVARTDNADSEKPVYTWVQENLNELAATMVRVPPKALSDGGAELVIASQDMIGFRVSSRNQVPKNKINPVGIPVNPATKSWANPNWDVYPVPFPHVATGTSLDYAYTKPNYMAIVGFHNWQGYWPIHGYSSDNGKTWKAFESFPVGKNSSSEYPSGGQIAISPTNPLNMVWAPSWGPSTHYTMDGGKTWKPALTNTGETLPNSWGNRIHPYVTSYILTADKADSEGKTFYYFDGTAFYYSKDSGATWTKSKTGDFPSLILRPIILSNPLKPGDVWLSFQRNPEDIQPNPLYQSIDGGQTFSKVKSVDSSELIAFGKGDKDIPAIYLFGRVNGAQKDTLYKSADMGKTWKAISDPQTLQFPAGYWMEGDMRQRNIVYVATLGRGVMVGELQSSQTFNIFKFTKNLVDSVIKLF